MATETESFRGWNNTCVLPGRIVRVRKEGFGHHCLAEVVAFMPHPKPPGTAEVKLVKVHKDGLRPGNRFEIYCAWLEGEPII